MVPVGNGTATSPSSPHRAPAPAASGGLRQGRFATDGLSEDEGRQAYLDRLDGILDTVFLEPFIATLEAYHLGAFGVIHLAATARRSSRLPRRIAHNRYDSIGIQYIVSGRAGGEARDRPIVSDPGTIMILDYDQPFSVTDLEPRTVVNIAVPRGIFPDHADVAAFHGAILAGPAATVLAGFMRDLGAVLASLPAESGPVLARVFRDLLLLALEIEDKPGIAVDRDARLIARAEQLVDGRIGLPELDPAWLAGRLGLSRSELYEVMDRFGGVSRFIMKRRLEAARAALENPADQRRIGGIAFAFGFSSEAHFARAFRAAFGTTASAIRQQARTESQKLRTSG